jgi:hypothetical protein
MIANEPVPVYSTLADVFGSVQASLPHVKRWNEFEQRFRRKPAYIARVAGCVK